jgi:uncharacterized cupin superfamily protein
MTRSTQPRSRTAQAPLCSRERPLRSFASEDGLAVEGEEMGMVVSAQASDARLEPAPIRAEWVLEGDPQARSALLSGSADGMAMTAVWDCTAGAFNWFFGGDETVHILEGEVIVDDGSGPRTLAAGDVAFFPAGTWARWEVPRYVKKLAFCRDPLPKPVQALVRTARTLKGMLKKGAPAGGLAPAAA